MHTARVGTGCLPFWPNLDSARAELEALRTLWLQGHQAPGPSGRRARVPTHRLVRAAQRRPVRQPSPVPGLFPAPTGAPEAARGWRGLQAPLRKGQGPGLGAPPVRGPIGAPGVRPGPGWALPAVPPWRPASGSCQQRVAPIGIPSTAWALCSPGSESGLLLSAQLWGLSPDR